MTPTSTTDRSRLRMIHAASALGHLVIAIALIALASAQASIILPVALSVPVVDGIGVFAHVDFAAAAAIVVLISVASHTTIALLRTSSAPRDRLVQLVAFAQASAITVFLVAQVNGVAEAGALILIYAIAGGAAGLLWLQARELGDRSRARWPFSLAAGLAVVPWGIVALYQIVGIVIGSPPAVLVRVLTVVILLLAAVAWWVERVVQLGTLHPHRAAMLHAALSLANGVALLLLAAGLSRPSALL